MKILLLSDPSSIHTKRWVMSLCQKDINIGIFGHVPTNEETIFYETLSNCSCFWVRKDGKGIISKIAYLKVVPYLKNVIKQWQPDIVHAHWATRYGLIGALSGFHPLITSVWGSDVLILPQKSFLYRIIIKFVLKHSDYVFSTSYSMAKETNKYTTKKVEITPFGVNTDLFKKVKDCNSNTFVVGNVKSLDPIYGIDILIKAFKVVVDKNQSKTFRLEIIGDGPNKQEYVNLVNQLGLTSKVIFMGRVRNTDLPYYYNSFSVAVFPSLSESFGVVAIESMSCECPVVVSDADGLKEVVENGKTGIVVNKGDIEATASAIQLFVDNPSLREKMGAEGRKRVLANYSWDDNVTLMLDLYTRILSRVNN